MSLTVRVKRIQQLLEDEHELLLDQAIAEQLCAPKYQDSKKLNRYEHKVFSQSGEDGIIAEIFKRIGTRNRLFVECSPGNGLESNTLHLLTQGWTGLWIEAEPRIVRDLKTSFSKMIERGALSVRQQLVTTENFEPLLDEASLPLDFDLLAIDIDRNDYWVWQRVQRYHPCVVVIEYNAIFPPGSDWVVEDAQHEVWDRTSNAGASLTALEKLAVEKGYKLVGCTLAGTNAFFVRDDMAGDHFLAPFTAENHYEPPRYYLTSRQAGHRRGVPTGAKRSE